MLRAREFCVFGAAELSSYYNRPFPVRKLNSPNLLPLDPQTLRISRIRAKRCDILPGGLSSPPFGSDCRKTIPSHCSGQALAMTSHGQGAVPLPNESPLAFSNS